MKVGGAADCFLEVLNTEELRKIVLFCQMRGLRLHIIGAGTKLLIRDKGISGIVVKLGGEFREIKIDGSRVYAGAGVPLPALSREVLRKELSGLEFACDIPGVLGGGITQNCGAFGSSISEVVESVKVMSLEGSLFELGPPEVGFSYRRSQIKPNIILGATLCLKRGKGSEIEHRMRDFKRRRAQTQPIKHPTCGCIFKNPFGTSAGELISRLGLKGFRVGGAEVSRQHANFIINLGGAKASDILRLIEKIQEKARDMFGVTLELEVEVVGRT
jgi:UDP-N-acetylmuramate dehydrogenase